MINLKSVAGLMMAASVVGMVSCSSDSKDTTPVTPPTPGPKAAVVEGQITGTRKLSADTVYTLKGYVRVMNGGSLEIAAGTVIKGDNASKAALIVERGGKIYAKGTQGKPIVFTSSREKGSRAIGDWAGIIICGKAKVNTPDGTGKYEGGVLGTDVANYGGNEDDDNSGEFTYVRIEYAGVAIESNKEINGLTLCGVGRNTLVHHVQISFGGDDGFEMFGGTVNLKNVIVYRTTDDDFDFDQGYTGAIQYGISIKDPKIADGAGTSRGIECENKGSVANGLYSKPVLSNFTFIGPGKDGITPHGAGVHFGLNSRFVFRNSIVLNSKAVAAEINGEDPAKSLKDGNAEFSDNLVFGNDGDYKVSNATTFATAAALRTFLLTQANTVLAGADAAGITSIVTNAPNMTLKAGSVAKAGAKFTGVLDNANFTKVAFRGAMDTEDWTLGWANWDPQKTDY